MDFNGNVESTKRFLLDEVEKNKHTLDNPFGNAASYKKVVEYLYACVVSDGNVADAKEWLYGLYAENNQKDEAKETFHAQVELVADVLDSLKTAGKLK